jgi:ribosomal protein L17
MRWWLAGLLFALAVAQAIGTAALRAENARLRFAVESLQTSIQDRRVEHARLVVDRLADSKPERLAAAHWTMLQQEYRRRHGGAP